MVGGGPVIPNPGPATRLGLARTYGATHVVAGDPAEIAAQIVEITGRGADYGFETTGNAGVARGMFDGLSPVGSLGVAGVGFGELSLSQLSLFPGRSIQGIFEGDSIPTEFIPQLAQLNADGDFPYDELITTFAFEDINAAEAASASGDVIKPVIEF